MLGKLIKYDLKAMNRFLIVIHGFLLLSAVLMRVFLTGHIQFDSPRSGTLAAFSFFLYFTLICGVSFGTLIVIAVRFYKNLFSDEGYLTHTLPVTSSQHLLSKTIAGSIWSIIDTLLILFSMYIVTVTPSVKSAFHENRAEVLQAFGLPASGFQSYLPKLIITMLILTLISAVCNCITVYASVALGQLFSGHRVLGAVVAYFVLTTVISVIAFAVTVAAGAATASYIGTAAKNVVSMNSMLNILWLSAALSLIITIVLYILTHYIMKKKINLI